MDAPDRLGDQLTQILRRVDALEKRAVNITMLDADADAQDGAGLWVFNDDRIRRKRPDGSIAQYSGDAALLQYVEDLLKYRVVPTLAAAPAASTGINMWVLSTTRELQVRTPSGVVGYAATATGALTASGAAPTRPSTAASTTVTQPALPTLELSYDDVFSADWAGTYDGSGNLRDTGSELQYGQLTDSQAGFGRQSIMVSFQSAATQLAGATIESIDLVFNTYKTEGRTGAIMWFGLHNATSKPATYSRIAAQNFKVPVDSNQPVVARLSTRFGERLRDGNFTGFTVESPSDSRSFAGTLAADVKLRVRYFR